MPAGGVTDVSQSATTMQSNGMFSSSFSQTSGVTALNAASRARACSGSLNGRFHGLGGSHIGVAFNMLDAGTTANATATAVAVFARP